MPKSRLDGPATYQMKVSGHLDQSWSDWFNGMTITYDNWSDNTPTTMLSGPVADQSALHGILSKIWGLNLVLISLTRIEMNSLDDIRR